MTIIKLLNCVDLDIQHNNTPYFENESAQQQWFSSKALHSHENCNYHRKNSNLRVNHHIDDIDTCNYVMVNNDDKWFYYFVVDKLYINQLTTELVLKLDVIQTYLFDFSLTECLVERMHYNRYNSDGSVNKTYFKTEDTLETGEYIREDVPAHYVYNKKGSFIICSSDMLGYDDKRKQAIPPSSSGSIGEYPYNSSISKERNDRFSKIWQGVKEAQAHGLFPSVTYAQYVMECGWEGSTLSETYNNAFGIKAGGDWTGKTVELSTQEYIDGQWITTTATWRVYDDINQSVRDRTQFLLENSRYTQGGVFTASTYKEQCQALQNSGYATDPSYASLLISIIEDNNFTIYDTVSSSDGSGSTDGYSSVVTSARKLIGKPYVYGGNYPPLGDHNGTDCSGLCEWAYQDAGINTGLAHRWTTYTMYPFTKIIPLSEAKAGDVIYTNFVNGVPNHVRIFVSATGNNVRYVGAENEEIGIIENTMTFDPNNHKIGRF